MSPEQRWEHLNVAYENFCAYIKRKRNPDRLSYLDLLHTSNFKGGNSSIVEREDVVNARLSAYSRVIGQIRQRFGNRKLGSLTAKELASFKNTAQRFIDLASDKDSRAKIKGFGPSYASGLLCAHFPKLAPVLDRNVLEGVGIRTKTHGNQVVRIEQHYEELIENIHSRLSADKHLDLRELDKELFVSGSWKLKKQGKASRAGKDAT